MAVSFDKVWISFYGSVTSAIEILRFLELFKASSFYL